MHNDTFCAAPWGVYTINPNGTVGLCCINRAVSGPNDDIGSFYSSPEIMAIKKAMISGDPVKGCERCYQQERSGMPWSLRRTYNDEAAAHLDPSRLMEPGYENRLWYDLSLSNKCNQKCRICGPSNSTAWIKDADQLKDLDWSHLEFGRPAKGYVTSEGTIPDVIRSMRGSSAPFKIELKGGEPLYLEDSKSLLRAMIDERLQDRCAELRIITNGTACDADTMDLLRAFSRIDLAISVDAVGGLHEYTRGTSMTWDQCRASWQRLANLPNVGNLRLCNTVYIYTAFDQDNLRRWARSEFGEGIGMTDAILRHPMYLNIKIMPDHLRHRALEMTPMDVGTRGVLGSEVTWSDIGHGGPEGDMHARLADLRQRFIEYTRRLDALRGENLLDLVPDLADMLV